MKDVEWGDSVMRENEIKVLNGKIDFEKKGIQILCLKQGIEWSIKRGQG